MTAQVTTTRVVKLNIIEIISEKDSKSKRSDTSDQAIAKQPIRQRPSCLAAKEEADRLHTPSSDMPLGGIPYLCGYDSANFFQRMFKRESGMTMRAWRQKNRC